MLGSREDPIKKRSWEAMISGIPFILGLGKFLGFLVYEVMRHVGVPSSTVVGN